MTTAQYLEALKQLGLPPTAIKTRKVLGLQARQLMRLAKGDTLPTPMLENLLTALMEKRK